MVTLSSLFTFFMDGSRWVFLAVLGFTFSRTHGSYSPEFLILVFFSALLFIWRSARQRQESHKVDLYFIFGTLAFFLGRLWSNTSLEYSIPSRTHLITPILLGFSSVALAFFYFFRKTVFLVLLFIFLSMFLILVPYLSPDPHIDVFTITRAAVTHLLNGVNPYVAEYQDTWSAPFGYKPGYSYPPAPLFLSAAFFKLFGDFRFLYASCLICSGLLLVRYRKTLDLGVNQAWALSCLWLSFPVNPLIVEQAWVDPLLIFTGIGLAITLAKENTYGAAVLLGVQLATKQYAVITLVFTVLWLFSRNNREAAKRIVLVSVLVCILICTPFFITNPLSFFQMVALDVLAVAPRSDAFTFFAFSLNEFGITLHDWLTPLVLLGCLSFFTLRWRKEKPQLSDWAFALSVTTTLVFLFSRRAFVNYFHFSASFLMIYLASYREREKGAPADF